MDKRDRILLIKDMNSRMLHGAMLSSDEGKDEEGDLGHPLFFCVLLILIKQLELCLLY